MYKACVFACIVLSVPVTLTLHSLEITFYFIILVNIFILSWLLTSLCIQLDVVSKYRDLFCMSAQVGKNPGLYSYCQDKNICPLPDSASYGKSLNFAIWNSLTLF